MNRPAETPKVQTNAYRDTIFFSFIYITVALACLRQWDSSDPWLRVDFFSGSFLAMSLLSVAELVGFNRAVGHSREVHREAFGMSYDPETIKGVALLALGELTVYLDYGHWHLMPALEQPVLQTMGLALYLIHPAWLVWADIYLARHFSDQQAARAVITGGPFRYVRHPRYIGLIASRVAFALVLASPPGWLLALGWTLLILRRIRLEEAHLRELFGADYDAYARRRARLLPGVY